MKELKRDLKSVLKSLKFLTQQTERIAKKLDKLDKARAAKKPKAKTAKKRIIKRTAVRKAREVTAMEAVLGLIKKSKKGVDTTTLKKKTGFNDKKIWNAINRLKNQKKVKSKGRGVYVKA